MNRVRNSGPGTPDGRNAAPIKTYLIEGCGPLPDPDDVVGPFGTLRLITQDPVLSDRFPVRMHPSSDPCLATIRGLRANHAPISFYVDYTDPRFWLLYGFAPSRIADRFISMLVATHRDVGRTTFCSEFLSAATDIGSAVALSLDHEGVMDEEEKDVARVPESVKARLWGTQAERLTNLMRQLGSLSDGIALSQVRLRHSPGNHDSERFSLNDVRFDGRMITRGTSFSAHRSLAEALRTRYARQVADIESGYQVRLEDSGGVLLGKSLALHLARPVRNLQRLCERIFSSASPFLLWGLPVQRGPGSVCVKAVDLDLGQRMDLEFTPDFIRLFVPKETSGSAVLRFYTNVQHRLDPRVRMLDQDENEILQP